MIRTIAELRSRLDEERGNRVALVSTIGALHDGHRDLIRQAKESADTVVVSMFRNPLRFRNDSERDQYPQTPEVDATVLAELGIDIAFAPAVEELFPDGRPATRVNAGEIGLRYDGTGRPSYFNGLLTVEAQLFHLIRPDVAVYGLRDPQRVFLVRRMIRELFFDVRVETVDVVRHESGLPLSSRIALLEDQALAAAEALPRALDAVMSNADRGIDASIASAQGAIMGDQRVSLDYLAIVDPETFLLVDDDFSGRALALIGATVAGHRFIDNAEIYVP